MLVILICKMLLINFYDFDIFFTLFDSGCVAFSVVLHEKIRCFDIFNASKWGLGFYLCSLNEIVSTT